MMGSLKYRTPSPYTVLALWITRGSDIAETACTMSGKEGQKSEANRYRMLHIQCAPPFNTFWHSTTWYVYLKLTNLDGMHFSSWVVIYIFNCLRTRRFSVSVSVSILRLWQFSAVMTKFGDYNILAVVTTFNNFNNFFELNFGCYYIWMTWTFVRFCNGSTRVQW